MKILLFNPYSSFTDKAYVFYRASVPYNLMYIAGYLQKHGIDSSIYELGVFDEDKAVMAIRPSGRYVRCGIMDYEIINILRKEKPDIVGITTMYTVFHNDYVEIIKTIKEFNPNIHIVVGGNHASSFPEKMLQAGADQVVVGEGEEAFLDICRGNRDKIVRKEFIDNLDDIPFPAYEKIDLMKYLSAVNPFNMRPLTTGLITSRGCPNDCCYCTVNGVWQRKWRGRSPENVVKEIKFLKDTYGITAFSIMDDNMMVDKKRLGEICDLIIKEKLNIKWATPAAHWAMNFGLMDKMKAAGCYRLSFGIESGDEETRKFIGKDYPLQDAKDKIQYANKIGMWTVITNIIGFPYETKEQIENTIRFSLECEADFACFFLLIPHPSSRVYQYYVKEKLLDEDDFMSAMNEGGCRTVNFSKEELQEYQRLAYKWFIENQVKYYKRHPGHLLRKVHSFEDLKYLFKIAKMGLSMKKRSGQKVSSSKDFIYGKRQYV